MEAKSLIALCALLTVLQVLLPRIEALSCPVCNKEKNCKQDLTICKHGLTVDTCGCCDVCAKGLGDECGGLWNHGGRCTSGLMCTEDPDNWQKPGLCVEISDSTTEGAVTDDTEPSASGTADSVIDESTKTTDEPQREPTSKPK